MQPVGETASYSYDVTNDGDVPLANVTVTDDKCSPVVSEGGDTNDNDLLDLTETWTYSCSTSLTEDTTNTATATGFDVNEARQEALAEKAASIGVERFVMISTDKAASPKNLLGQSKAVCEWIVAAMVDLGRGITSGFLGAAPLLWQAVAIVEN